MTTGVANVEAQEYWSNRARSWLEDQEGLDIFGRAPGEAAIDRLAPRPGERIVDIGCGGGGTTVAIAQRVAPGGRALGVDIAAGMVAAAQHRAEAGGCENASFIVGDAQVADLGKGEFQGAFSRFGITFFADPVAAFANIHRCLAQAGRLSFCCWQAPLANEWMTIPTMVTLAVLRMAPPEPAAPGPFAFADPDNIRSVLEAAGFSGVDIALRNDIVELSEADIATRTRVALRQGLVAQLLKEVPDETREQVRVALQDSMRDRLEEGVVRLRRGYQLVTARA